MHDDLPDITYDVGKQHAGWVDGNQSWEGMDHELFRGDLFHYLLFCSRIYYRSKTNLLRKSGILNR